MLYKVIPSNPLANYSYKPGHKGVSRLRVFTEEEMDTLLDYYKGKDLQAWIQLCFLRYCGLRLGGNERDSLVFDTRKYAYRGSAILKCRR